MIITSSQVSQLCVSILQPSWLAPTQLSLLEAAIQLFPAPIRRGDSHAATSASLMLNGVNYSPEDCAATIVQTRIQ